MPSRSTQPATSAQTATRATPDLTSRSYWNGTVKMSLSKFFILRVLHDRPMHGYDIARRVAQATNGCCSPSEGTIYPVLREFEEGGYVTFAVEVVGGRERKVYTLTDRGHEALRMAVAAWMEITDALVDADKVVTRAKAPADPCCD
jgi:PadR family transcriptional regulator, regulatory protein PadR